MARVSLGGFVSRQIVFTLPSSASVPKIRFGTGFVRAVEEGGGELLTVTAKTRAVLA